MTALLLSKNHDIKVMGVTTQNSFVNTIHRFFNTYVPREKVSQAIKDKLLYKNKEEKFHTTSSYWMYKNDAKVFWKICEEFALTLSKLTRKIIMFFANSMLSERSWLAMNLIINKICNSLNAINVDKLMFIYINKCALHWQKEKRNKK